MEEEGPAIGRLEIFRLGPLHDGRQLGEIADQNDLDPAKGLIAFPVEAQGLVDRPHHVGADHGNLVDHQGFQRLHNTAVAHFADIPRADHARREVEEGVDGLATRLHRRHAGRRDNGRPIARPAQEFPHQRGLAGPGPPGDEDIRTRTGQPVQQAFLMVGQGGPRGGKLGDAGHGVKLALFAAKA